jgi:hypothetical protein
MFLFHPFYVYGETHVWNSKIFKFLILPNIVNIISR